MLLLVMETSDSPPPSTPPPTASPSSASNLRHVSPSSSNLPGHSPEGRISAEPPTDALRATLAWLAERSSSDKAIAETKFDVFGKILPPLLLLPWCYARI